MALVLATALLSLGCRVCEAGDSESRSEERQRQLVAGYETAKYLASSGQLKEAHSQIKKLRRQAKGDVEKALVEDALASYYLAKRELPAAEKHASAALDLHPAFSVGFRTRALVRVLRGDSLGAEEDFRSALSFDGSDLKSLRGLAEIYQAHDRGPEALRLVYRYLELDSLDAWAQDTWVDLMGAGLGYENFPLDYLRCLKSAAISRGELAAILVVALESAERKETSSDSSTAPGVEAGGSPLESPSDGERSCRDCASRWYAQFVEKSMARGLMRTYPDTSFRPDDPVDKGLLANDLYLFLARSAPAKVEAVLVRPMEALRAAGSGTGSPRVPGTGYSDVFILSYLWRPVRVAVELGLLEPESDSAFGVDSPVSGSEAARMAENLARLVHSP
ncbi:MAG: S-layer homology domain-containing protein [Candidatus Eisenbacteria bacterium]|nr:S-layer homology domain-containing protein [Candidatus Eisenbacteria bacterium]